MAVASCRVPFKIARFLPFLLALLLSSAAGQELTLLGGGMSTRDGLELSSYTYQFDYRQNVTRYLAASVAYLNEGHIVGHHRDGTAFEGWLRLPLLKDRLALAAGVGPYYFYDTQPRAADTVDVHGTATISSLSATAYVWRRWYLMALFNRIDPHRDGVVKTNTTAVGAGFWFGQERRPTKGKLGDAADEKAFVTENELTLFGGQSIVNTLFSEHAFAAAVEYRRGVIRHVDWTASAIYEGDPKIIRRKGVATQLWAVNTFFGEKVIVGAGLGPYFYIDRKHPEHRTLRSPAAAAPLVSFTLATRLNEQWIARLIFERVTSNYNRDSDLILLGMGYHWGG